MKCLLRTTLLIIVFFVTYSCDKDDVPDEVTDADGNIYHTVTIGRQVWMIENLKTTKYRDGSNIPLIADSAGWVNLRSPGYCWYDNDQVAYKDSYGALYNWYAAKTASLCPKYWHVPSEADWRKLEDYLGGSSVAGGKLKEDGYNHWLSPNIGATNETGFTALPGGLRDSDASFKGAGEECSMWSAIEVTEDFAYSMNLEIGNPATRILGSNKLNGFTVRCMMD